MGGNAGCTVEVKVGTSWNTWGNMIAREGGIEKDVDGESSFTIFLR